MGVQNRDDLACRPLDGEPRDPLAGRALPAAVPHGPGAAGAPPALRRPAPDRNGPLEPLEGKRVARALLV